MKLLLDTHAFVWATSAPERLTKETREAIADPRNDVFISAAVAWEIAIKYALKKIDLPVAPATYVPTRVAALGFKALPITMEHTLAVGALADYHRDPFDRLLIAQAQVEGFTLVTSDEHIQRYNVHWMAA